PTRCLEAGAVASPPRDAESAASPAAVPAWVRGGKGRRARGDRSAVMADVRHVPVRGLDSALVHRIPTRRWRQGAPIRARAPGLDRRAGAPVEPRAGTAPIGPHDSQALRIAVASAR